MRKPKRSGLRPLALAVALGVPSAALAGQPPQTVHGNVIAIDARDGLVYVHHDPFGGMPAMTMPFEVDRTVIRRLHRGDTVTATLVVNGDHWTLRDVRAAAGPAPAPAFVPTLHAGDLIPDTPLVDQRGRPFSLRKLDGRMAIVAFIFTRCRDPKMCPLVTLKFMRLQRLVDPATTHLVEVTLDPRYDTPEVLARYGAAVQADPARWTLATGEPQAVADLAARLGIDARPDPSAIFVHGEAAIVVDPSGRIADVIEGNDWTPEEVAARAAALAHRRANPFELVALSLARNVSALCGGSAGIAGWTWLALFGGLLALFGAGAYRVARSLFR